MVPSIYSDSYCPADHDAAAECDERLPADFDEMMASVESRVYGTSEGASLALLREQLDEEEDYSPEHEAAA